MKLHSLPHVYVAVYTHYKKNVLLRRAKTAAKAQKTVAKGPMDL